MGFAVTEPREKSRRTKPTSPRKTASGEFFAKPNRTRLENRRQPLKTQVGKPTYAYKIASGRPFWPSRDPIGENWATGEFNEYAFVKNNGVNLIDRLGLNAAVIVGGGAVISGEAAIAIGAIVAIGAIDVANINNGPRPISLPLPPRFKPKSYDERLEEARRRALRRAAKCKLLDEAVKAAKKGLHGLKKCKEGECCKLMALKAAAYNALAVARKRQNRACPLMNKKTQQTHIDQENVNRKIADECWRLIRLGKCTK